MRVDKTDGHLSVQLDQDLNWFTARRIRHLAEDCHLLQLDLRHARLVDSEGLILLFDCFRAGKTVRLYNPPDIMFEVANLLGIDEIMPLDTMINPEE